MDDRAFGRDDAERPGEPLVRRDGLGRERREDVEHRRSRDREVGIHGAAHLWRRAAEVDARAAAADADRDRDRDVLGAEAVVVEHVAGAIDAARDAGEVRVHERRRVGLQRRHLAREPTHPADTRYQCTQPVRADAERRPLRHEIALALGTDARVREEDGQHVRLRPPSGDQADRRQPQAFLVDLRRERHRPRRHPADVGVMRAIGDVGEGPAASAQEDGGHHRHVGQMGTARERVVQHRHVAGAERHAGDRGADGQRRRAEVHRDVRRLRDERAAGVEDRAREIPSLLDVRRHRRAAEHDAHLLGHGGKPLVGDGERDCVHHARSRTSPPNRSTRTHHLGGTTVVALYSQMTRGPRAAHPAGSSIRR